MQLVGYYALEGIPSDRSGHISEVDRNAVCFAEAEAYEQFRMNVLEPVVSGLSADQHAYLRAMAEVFDDGRARTGEVAQALGKSQRQLSVIRDRLMRKRVIVADGHGFVRYNLPHMHQYFTDPIAFPSSDVEDTWKHE